jgi:hypothetical protein
MRYWELTEGVYAPLYHSTNLLAAINIIKNNEILPKGQESRVFKNGEPYYPTSSDNTEYSFVSLTRDLTFAKQWRHADVIFVLNQTKLRQSVKISPFDYHYWAWRPSKANPVDKAIDDPYFKKIRRSEAEEYTRSAITPLDTFLTKILVSRNAAKRFADIAKKDTIAIPRDSSKPMYGNNVKFVKRYKGVTDPNFAATYQGWDERNLIFRHPLIEYY